MKTNNKNNFIKILSFFLLIVIINSCLGYGGKESAIPKKSTFMYALLDDESVTISSIEENMKKNNEFMINSKTLEENALQYVIQYKDIKFSVSITIKEIEGANYYRNINGIEKEKCGEVIDTTDAVEIIIEFAGSNNLESFHFQSKLLDIIAPNGVILFLWKEVAFKYKKINGKEATVILLNEPYDMAYMKLGDEVKLKKSQLTDWIILNNRGEVILPDIAYKLDE